MIDSRKYEGSELVYTYIAQEVQTNAVELHTLIKSNNLLNMNDPNRFLISPLVEVIRFFAKGSL